MNARTVGCGMMLNIPSRIVAYHVPGRMTAERSKAWLCSPGRMFASCRSVTP